MAKDVLGAMFTENTGQSLAKLPVLNLQKPDAPNGGFKTTQQRRVSGPLPVGWLAGNGGGMALTEALDFGTQIVLGVKPGPGDAGLAREPVITGGMIQLRMAWRGRLPQ